MNKDPEGSLVETLQEQLSHFETLIEGAPAAQADRLRPAAEKLRVALEELHVAEEELRQQNEELLATRVALEEERLRYKDLFDLAPDGYLVTDLHGLILEANQAAGDLLRLSPERMAGKPLAVFVSRDDEPAFRHGLLRVAEETGPLHWELRLQPRGGEPFPASIAVAARGDTDESKKVAWLLRDVTEETRVEEELVTSRQRLEAHMDNSPLAVIEFDPAFRVVRWSKEAERLFGWAEAEVRGRGIANLRWVHEDDAESVRRVSEDLISGTASRSRNANRNYTKDGAVVECEWYNSAIYDGEGRLVSVLSQVLDVTERKRVEQALAENERNFRCTFDQAPVGAAMVDMEGRFRRANEALCNILGYSEGELKRLRWDEITHPDDLEENREHARRLLEGREEIYQTDKRYVRKDGRPTWVRISVRVIRDEEEKPLHLLPMVEDINERKRLEAQLRESWERYTLGESIAHFGTWERNMEEDRAVWSPECYRIFGRDPERGAPDFEEFLEAIHPEDRDRVQEQTLQHLARNEDIDIEYRIVRPDGCEHVIHSMAKILDGDRKKMVGVLHDVTELREKEAELRLARREAEQAAQAKSDFLASMSHEIRTPLNGVLGMTEVLAGTDLDAEQADCLEAIRLSGKLLLGIVNDILDLSRIEAGRLSLASVAFHLRHAVDDTMHLLAEPAQRKGLEICTLIEPEVPAKVRGDPGRFRQLLINLVGNATKFTDRGEVTLRVGVVRSEGERTWVRVEVSDTGPGVREDLAGALFEPFAQVDSSSETRFGGTGLGLSISKRLTEAMGGEIGYRTEPGVGSTFWFAVPFDTVQSTESCEPGFDGARALVAMSRATARGFAEALLAQIGVDAIAVGEGASALEQARAAAEAGEAFHVVLVDLDLPDGDALELAARFQEGSLTRDLPVVVLTPVHKRHFVLENASGKCRCLLKPLREREVRECLGAVLDSEAIPFRGHGPFTVAERLCAGRRVLLAEDNEVNRRVAHALLLRFGCQVDTAYDGEEAVQVSQFTPYDLVFMDWRMPGVDGLEATRRIREGQGASSQAPIVAMTANALPEHREQCLAAGMNDFVAKPLTSESLRAVLHRWLGSGEVEVQGREVHGLSQRLEDFERLLGAGGVADLLHLTLETMPSEILRLERIVREGRIPELARAVHGFKGTCSQFGTARLVDLCAELESRAEGGSRESFEEILAEMRTEYEKVQNVLGEALRKLEGAEGQVIGDQ